MWRRAGEGSRAAEWFSQPVGMIESPTVEHGGPPTRGVVTTLQFWSRIYFELEAGFSLGKYLRVRVYVPETVEKAGIRPQKMLLAWLSGKWRIRFDCAYLNCFGFPGL